MVQSAFSSLLFNMYRFSFGLLIQFLCIFLVPNLIVSNPSTDLTRKLCSSTTDAIIEHYGYEAEVHDVITEDGYILTVFRCNSKKFANMKRKSVILQHGLIISSDDFCINMPNQSLAYVLADAGYDVWLPNSRGNFYSRKHKTKDPNQILDDFWDFTWYEMGVYDQPAVIDYVLAKTNSSKTHYIGFSQGTTSLLVMLSERPEYNDKIYAASLLAPVGYIYYSDSIYKLFTVVMPLLRPLERNEFLPRNPFLKEFMQSMCAADTNMCNTILDIFLGPSENQRNDTMLPAFICRVPSGSSLKQFLHYGEEIKLGYFGKYRDGAELRNGDFDLSKITAPISVHYSIHDRLADATDVEKLISKLPNVAFIQRINELFNHVDFVWGIHSASLIYSKILNVFEKY